MPSSNSIFVSYRRSDSNDVTGRIYDFLSAHFGREVVFKDVDSIPAGRDFRVYLNQTVGQCQGVVAVIGATWLEVLQQRLGKPDIDWVRSEIALALERGIPVIPLLVGGAEVPRAENLPTDLEKLAFCNARQARPDPDFKPDMARLIGDLDKIVSSSDKTTKLSLADKLKLESLRTELQDQEQDYKAVEKEYKVALDPLIKRRLKSRLSMIVEEMDELEAQIQAIEQGYAGSKTST